MSNLNFVLKLFFAFGLAFEVPIITLVIILAKLTTVESLSRKRPYIIVFAFIIGMILTPPDVISQVLLAIPIWVLFEFGLFLAKIITKNKGKKKLGNFSHILETISIFMGLPSLAPSRSTRCNLSAPSR